MIEFFRKYDIKYNPNDVSRILKKTAKRSQDTNIYDIVRVYDPRGMFLRNRRIIEQATFGAGMIQAHHILEYAKKRFKISE